MLNLLPLTIPQDMTLVAFFPGGMGSGEMIVVGIIALLLFGKRLPEVARNLGKGFSEFKKGVSGVENEFRSAANTSSAPRVDYNSTPDTAVDRPAAESDGDAADEFSAPKFEVPAE